MGHDTARPQNPLSAPDAAGHDGGPGPSGEVTDPGFKLKHPLTSASVPLRKEHQRAAGVEHDARGSKRSSIGLVATDRKAVASFQIESQEPVIEELRFGHGMHDPGEDGAEDQGVEV